MGFKLGTERGLEATGGEIIKRKTETITKAI